MAGNILIIGNGFDLYHKLPTRYVDFMFFASEWETFFQEYEAHQSEGLEVENNQISVPLTDKGELTQEALSEFGRHPTLFNSQHIEYLRENLQSNCWIKYFQEVQGKLNWVDFETEIQSALYDTEEYSMEALPRNVGKHGKDGLPDRLKRIPDIFGRETKEGYIDFGDMEVIESYADKAELQRNKLKLIDFMLEELNKLITCLEYYLNDFVCHIKCNCYSQQVKAISDVDILNFNYTTTYNAIYGGYGVHEHHAVHGGISHSNIVLGISDDAFPDTHDYIRFQKFFQRIQKRTGSFYREWINYELEDDGTTSQKEVYIMGHSLGLADFGVLRDFFEAECFSKAIIFYYNQKAYEDLVINLVKALGREKVVERIGSGKIEFRELNGPAPTE